MKKTLRTLIVGMILAFSLSITVPLLVAQQTPSPQPTPSISQSVDAPVVFDGERLFVIEKGLGNMSPQNRAKAISTRLLQLAEDDSIPLEDIQVYVGDKEGIPLDTGIGKNL